MTRGFFHRQDMHLDILEERTMMVNQFTPSHSLAVKMPLQALRTVSKGQNDLTAFARANPQVEITVSPRPRKHPVIKGTYINGREKAICVRNLEKEQIMKKAELLRDASGDKLRKVTKPVKSINESVRGIWDPFHGSKWSV
ncbi:unnamed protein product [Aureobasidium pullulans]|nr:unnamed protein product [Aureobasidium pullulans]CAD0025640.1 unnamed protein product [Aureobasidium pullulans]CAD0050569.1 unnamed protein product [Aureobasidium pullulans]